MTENKTDRPNGIGGWLLFFAVIAGIVSTVQLVQFPGIIIEGNIKTILHSCLLIFAALSAFILIMLKKKIAKAAYIFFITVIPVGGLLVRIFQLHEPIDTLAGAMVFIAIIITLVTLYFLKSKRVKNTLVR